MLMCWKQIDIGHASFRMFLGRQKLSYLCEQLILTELQKNPVWAARGHGIRGFGFLSCSQDYGT